MHDENYVDIISAPLRLVCFSQVLFRGCAFKDIDLECGTLSNSGFKGLDRAPR